MSFEQLYLGTYYTVMN